MPPLPTAPGCLTANASGNTNLPEPEFERLPFELDELEEDEDEEAEEEPPLLRPLLGAEEAADEEPEDEPDDEEEADDLTLGCASVSFAGDW
jgi:hypothetical protein